MLLLTAVRNVLQLDTSAEGTLCCSSMAKLHFYIVDTYKAKSGYEAKKGYREVFLCKQKH
jgi:hypothetical protein